jgi:hypothetical protein
MYREFDFWTFLEKKSSGTSRSVFHTEEYNVLGARDLKRSDPLSKDDPLSILERCRIIDDPASFESGSDDLTS